MDIQELLAALGPPVLLSWMIMESMGIPLPTELMLLSAGYVAAREHFSLLLALVAAMAGNLIGSSVSYRLGRAAGVTWIARLGRPVGIREHHLTRAQEWFQRRGQFALIWGRLIPGVRNLLGYPAGMMHVPFWRYMLYTQIGYSPLTVGSLVGGYVLGENWRLVLIYTDELLLGAGIVVLAGGVLYWLWRTRPRRMAARSKSGPNLRLPPK